MRVGAVVHRETKPPLTGEKKRASRMITRGTTACARDRPIAVSPRAAASTPLAVEDDRVARQNRHRGGQSVSVLSRVIGRSVRAERNVKRCGLRTVVASHSPPLFSRASHFLLIVRAPVADRPSVQAPPISLRETPIPHYRAPSSSLPRRAVV